MSVFESDKSKTVSQPFHYHALDLLRGVAAVIVIWKHFAGRVDLPGLAPHGYLAVDFFFVLSGFVVAAAYGERLASGTLTLAEFSVQRAIRLLPMIVLGTVLAALVEVGRPAVASQQQHLLDSLLALFLGVLVVPLVARTLTLEHTVFPLNTPTWSLFFELVSNLVYALWSRAGRRMPAVLLTCAASLALLIAAAQWFGNLNVGFEPKSFWLGFPRVAWSFSLGVAIYHYRARAPRAHVLWGPALLSLFLVTPTPASWNVLFEVVCVAVLLPAVVLVSVRVNVGPRLQRICAWSGQLSYPMYALHYPIVRVVAVTTRRFDPSLSVRVAVVMITTLVIIALSAFVLLKVDAPIRRRLAALRVQPVGRVESV
jgi:peptidoglycan/LPS O-acetylase OafA/YrhL